MGVNSLRKTVTRQRRDCDLNPGPSAPESSTLTTRLPSHPFLPSAKYELPPSSPLFSSLLPFPLEVGPLNTARGSGERSKPTNDLVHIGVKMCSSGGSSSC